MKKVITVKMTEEEAREKVKGMLGKNASEWTINIYLTSLYYNPLYSGMFVKKVEG